MQKRINKALNKSEYLVIIRDNFCQVCKKVYAVTPHLTRLDETLQIRGHNICFEVEIGKIIPQLSSNTLLILSRALINIRERSFHCKRTLVLTHQVWDVKLLKLKHNMQKTITKTALVSWSNHHTFETFIHTKMTLYP